jgi:hypothetical protein
VNLVVAKVDDPLENDDENDRGDEEKRAEKEARELELKRRAMLALFLLVNQGLVRSWFAALRLNRESEKRRQKGFFFFFFF